MKNLIVLAALLLLIEACATRRQDHFYTLQVLPAGSRDSRMDFAHNVSLRIVLPSLVDRGELVLASSGEVTVLEHERWAGPLADQLATALGQDIEQRRADLIVAPHLDNPGMPVVKILVDVVQFTAQRGGMVSIETHWRVLDTGSGAVSVGRDVFSARAASDRYADIPLALSSCVAQLADRLITQLPAM